MLTIHSPKFASVRPEITKNSPTYRNKRITSAQDNYINEVRHKIEISSPKLSEGKKKKSYMDLPTCINVLPKSNKGNKEIIDSIQNLKE